MPLSDRLNDLLDWWQLRIEVARNKTREDTKENNDTSNDIPSTVSTSNTMGTMEDARLTTNDNKENK
tara:strand:- start:3071 stop:3271 length:201 start_codon:yes stop_codon:yes gene_type:complete